MCNRDPNLSIPIKCTTIKGTKMKFILEETMKAQGREYRYISTLSLTSMVMGGGGVVNATHQPLYLWTQDLVPIVQESGWVGKILSKPGSTTITYSNLRTVQTERNYKYTGPHY